MDKFVFLLSEGIKNLWRHKLTAFSAIFSIFLTLIIAGSLVITSQNTNKVIDLLEEMNIAYRALPPNNWTDSAVIKDQKRSEDGMIDIFERCCGKNLFTIMYGKLYRCPFVSNAERLHAIPFDDKNGVSLESSIEEIVEYTSGIKYLPACNFCNGRSHDAPEIIPAIQAKEKLPFKKYINITLKES